MRHVWWVYVCTRRDGTVRRVPLHAYAVPTHALGASLVQALGCHPAVGEVRADTWVETERAA